MSKEDATQKGALNDAEGEDKNQDDAGQQDNVKETLSTRDEDMDDIVVNSRKKRDADDEAFRKEMRGESEGDADADADADSDAEDDIDGDQDDDLPENTETTTVKVDGIEGEVPNDVIEEAGGVAAYQKDKAASNRLREAVDQKEQQDLREQGLTKRETEVTEREKTLDQTKNKTQPSGDADAGLVSDDEIDEIVGGIFSGDEDEAKIAVRKIMKGRNTEEATPDVDINEIADQATEKAIRKIELRERNIEISEGNVKYRSEYEHIANNPMLNNLVNQETSRLQVEHPSWRPQQIIMAAAENVNEQFKDSFNQQKDADEDGKRRDRKRATDNVTGKDARKKSAPPEKPLSRSEIAQGMNANRSISQ